MEFTFATAGRVHFGVGLARTLPELVGPLGSRVMVVTGSSPERVAHLLEGLDVVETFCLAHEPTMDDARLATEKARSSGAEVVLGIGGGSVIDLAKAVGVLALGASDPMDHAEVIGGGLPLPARGLPVVAVPTTAGTGAEVTRNAVLTSPGHRRKVSLRSDAMMPRLAVVDPELTLDCPPDVTAAAGLDALTQCLEALTSRKANPLSDALCLVGLDAAEKGLRQAWVVPDDLDARTQMSLCSLMGGMALANSGLGAVHGLAGVVGGMTGAPHGAICGALLESTCAVNVDALKRREPKNPALIGYRRASKALSGVERIEAGQGWLAETSRVLDLNGLADFGLDPSMVDEVVQASRASSSMKGNPIELTDQELRFILESSF